MRIKIALLLTSVISANFAPALQASPQSGPKEIQDVATIDVKPKLLKPIEPVYPYNQARAGVNGSVLVRFIIDHAGEVQDPYVVESNNPAFERPALDAVLKWKFSPGKKDGRMVNVLAMQRIDFAMDRGGKEPDLWRVSKGKNHSTLPPEMQWDEPPLPVSTAFPVYPFEALRKELRGKTKLSFVVGPEGRVVTAKVTQATTPEMGLAALAMIDCWRFNPAKKKDGTPVYAGFVIEHEFNPQGFGDVTITYSARDILRLIEKHPEKIIAAGQLDQPPKPISRRPPVYPLAFTKTRQGGETVIEFYIDDEGDAQLPRIVSSSAPEFGYAAAQAVATWRFEPPKKGGKTVVTIARVPIEFNQLDTTGTAASPSP